MQENNKPQNNPGDELEKLKREAGFVDFSTINTLRIAPRTWIGYDREGKPNKGLALCVAKKGKPYALIGYYLCSVRISTSANQANDFSLLEEKPVKPNYTIFMALKEYKCGKWVEQYNPEFPPLIIKAQAVKPLNREIFKAIRETKELGPYPWLITYYGANPKLFSKYKMFEVGALKNEKQLNNLPNFEKIRFFIKLLEKYGLKNPNSVISITPENFDKAYKEAFAEEIERWKQEKAQIDSKAENNTLEELIIDDEDSSEEDFGWLEL